MYAFGAMLSFTIAHISVIRLRQHRSRRPAAVPRAGQRARRAASRLPLFAVFGGLGTAIVVRRRHRAATRVVALAGVVWLALGIGVYIVYRRNQGLDLDDDRRRSSSRGPSTEHEAEYESVLVAIDVAQLLAADRRDRGEARRARRRRGIHVLVTITVPYASPIGAELPEEEMRPR